MRFEFGLVRYARGRVSLRNDAGADMLVCAHVGASAPAAWLRVPPGGKERLAVRGGDARISVYTAEGKAFAQNALVARGYRVVFTAADHAVAQRIGEVEDIACRSHHGALSPIPHPCSHCPLREMEPPQA